MLPLRLTTIFMSFIINQSARDTYGPLVDLLPFVALTRDTQQQGTDIHTNTRSRTVCEASGNKVERNDSLCIRMLMKKREKETERRERKQRGRNAGELKHVGMKEKTQGGKTKKRKEKAKTGIHQKAHNLHLESITALYIETEAW